MDDIFLKKCTEADVDILRSLLSKTFSETFAHMNTPENMELYLGQAFARERILKQPSDGRGGEAGGREEEGVYLAWRLGEK